MKCRCAKTKKRLMAYTCDEELPARLREALEACPECRAFWTHMRRVSALIALKRHELPDEQMLERCANAVRSRLAALQEEAGTTAWDGLWGTTLPAFRFSMAALFMALLGLHIFSASHLPSIHTSERSLAEHVRSGRSQGDQQFAREERVNPDFPVMMISNWSPRVQQSSAYQFIGMGP